MIDSSVVLENLKLLLPLAQQMEPAAQLLCEQAAQAVSGKLAQPEFGQDTRATFAAAALAGSWLTQCRAADETRQLSFRAGDVSITQPQKSEGILANWGHLKRHVVDDIGHVKGGSN